MHKLITLKHCPLFKDLDFRELGIVASKVEEKSCAKQSILANPRQTKLGLVVVVSGRVTVRYPSSTQSEMMSSILGPYDHFGEFSLMFKSSQRRIEAVALDDVVFLSLSPQAFTDLKKKSPLLAVKIVRNIFDRHVESIQTLGDMLAEVV